MARIALANSLAPYADGVRELELDVANVRQLFEVLGARYPALQAHLEGEVAVAIDDEIYQDALLAPIGCDSEVVLISKIAGG